MTIDAQIAQLDATAIEYCVNLSDPRYSDEVVKDYFWNVAQGWLMVLGLRKAQLRSLRHFDGMALIA